MLKNILLTGVFNGQNIVVKSVVSYLQVRTYFGPQVVVDIHGSVVELLKIRVTRQENNIVIEGDGSIPGLEKMTVQGYQFANKEKIAIRVLLPSGGRVELASTFSGNTDIADGIRVAREIE